MKILITAPFDTKALDELEELGLQVEYRSWLDTGRLYLGGALIKVLDEVKPDVLIVEGDEIKEEVLNQYIFKMIGSVRGDPNNVALDMATKRGIPVVSAPGRNTIAVAEIAIALMLCHTRRIVQTDRLLRDEFMVDDFGDFAQMYKSSMGSELFGKTIGIVGLGKIGYEVAKRLRCFGVTILVYDPYVSSEHLKEVGGELSELETLLRRSDIVTIHATPTDETRGMLGAEQLTMMKSTAILINTGRASITDEAQLKAALQNKVIAGAALDVFSMEPVDCDNEFLELSNVTVTPHIGGNTIETIQRQSRMMVEAVRAILEGRIPENCLNPEVFR